MIYDTMDEHDDDVLYKAPARLARDISQKGDSLKDCNRARIHPDTKAFQDQLRICLELLRSLGDDMARSARNSIVAYHHFRPI